METARRRHHHTGALAGSSAYELLRSVRSPTFASSRWPEARASCSSLCGVCSCRSALSFSCRTSCCFAGLSVMVTPSVSSSSVFPFCASSSSERELSARIPLSLSCDFPSPTPFVSSTSSGASSRRSCSVSSSRSTPLHQGSCLSPVCAAPAQRCPPLPPNCAVASRVSVLCLLFIVGGISAWISRNRSLSDELSRPRYILFSSPFDREDWQTTVALHAPLRCKYTSCSPEGYALSSFQGKAVSSEAHSISLYRFSERTSQPLDLSLSFLLFAEGVSAPSPARSNSSLLCLSSLPSCRSEKGTRPGLLARHKSPLLAHLSYTFPCRHGVSSAASLSSSLSSSLSPVTTEPAPFLLEIFHTAKRRFFRPRKESQPQGILSTFSSPFSHSSLSCSPSLLSSFASPRGPSIRSSARDTRSTGSSFLSSSPLSSSRLSESRRLFFHLSPLMFSPSVSSHMLASVPPFPLSDTRSSPSSGPKQSSSSLKSSSSSSSALHPPCTASPSLSSNSSSRSSRSGHSCYSQASTRPLSQATSLSSSVSTFSSELSPLSTSTSSSQSTSFPSPDKSYLTILVKTAIGSPYIDVSYRLLLPLSATLADLQQALQIEILKQQQKYLDQLPASSPSTSSPEGNRDISPTSSFSQESNSSTSSSSSVVPPPIELLRLLYGGAPVTDPDLRLMTLLPQHLRGEDTKPKVLVFLLDLPTPPFSSPSLSEDRNADVLPSSSSSQGSPSSATSSRTSSSSSLEALAAHAAAFEQDAVILRRLQETVRSLDERTQQGESSSATMGTYKKDLHAIGKETKERDGEREQLFQETLEYAIWGNKHALPLQSSEEIHRRVSSLTSRYQPKETYVEPPSASQSSTQPSLVQEDDRRLPVESSESINVSTSLPCPDVFFEFPQLAPTLGARLKQNLKVEVDVDWAWILKLGVACTAVQFLIGQGKETEEENKIPISPCSSSSAQPSRGSHVFLKGIQKLFFSGTANKWRKRALLSVAPVVVLSSWRPVRFARKVLWYSLPRGRWWAVASPILTRHRESMLTLDEEEFLHAFEDDKKEQ
ncbi:hypothetical protein CSUI_002893 [Cystoisospora suis]|uniref:Transmembrane protein n=1 Tax=Cystoisospora suis TaxID=483139 RepID=A0A2C6L7I8_9APIC|nr:hypothetical protein CSUI_002893 [Cystoisospora suis]